MKFFQNRKAVLLVLSLVLVIAVGVGGTLAFLTDKTDEIQNTFTPTSAGVDITESFDGTTKSNVVINNTGDIPVYVRAMIVVSWQNENGQVLAPAPVLGTDYTMSLGSGWTENGIYYYYNSFVPKGGSTAPLIVQAQQIKACADQEYTLHIEIIAEAIQAEGMGATSAQDAFTKAAE